MNALLFLAVFAFAIVSLSSAGPIATTPTPITTTTAAAKLLTEQEKTDEAKARMFDELMKNAAKNNLNINELLGEKPTTTTTLPPSTEATVAATDSTPAPKPNVNKPTKKEESKAKAHLHAEELKAKAHEHAEALKAKAHEHAEELKAKAQQHAEEAKTKAKAASEKAKAAAKHAHDAAQKAKDNAKLAAESAKLRVLKLADEQKLRNKKTQAHTKYLQAKANKQAKQNAYDNKLRMAENKETLLNNAMVAKDEADQEVLVAEEALEQASVDFETAEELYFTTSPEAMPKVTPTVLAELESEDTLEALA